MQGSLPLAIMTAVAAVSFILAIRQTVRRRQAEQLTGARYRIAIDFALTCRPQAEAAHFLGLWLSSSPKLDWNFPDWKAYRARRERELLDEEATF